MSATDDDFAYSENSAVSRPSCLIRQRFPESKRPDAHPLCRSVCRSKVADGRRRKVLSLIVLGEPLLCVRSWSLVISIPTPALSRR
jgi:hypothetical protein